ncbi:hypothetical protein ONE63_003240 [Megalurothrips usitatus]|uniref:Uncharacterized protein n=1 Tax=Megalurothrips usitatus TaxID=439358 RepID=A0AAV7X6Q8_9NEOP|nr:hypothetical protein ONE63_003240 [Megalurothrips usitatus]
MRVRDRQPDGHLLHPHLPARRPLGALRRPAVTACVAGDGENLHDTTFTVIRPHTPATMKPSVLVSNRLEDLVSSVHGGRFLFQ